MNKFLLPVLFVFIFILESMFVQFLPGQLFDSKRIFVPHFLLTAILMLTIFGNRKYGILYGAIFGLLFDIVYTEIIGIYLFMFPLISYLSAKMMQVLQANIFISIFVTIIGISLLEFGVYELNYLISVTRMDIGDFFQFRFLPTLVLNLAFVIIVVYPLKRQFEKFAEELGND
ncbi:MULTISPECIES: rod shape-determining protein MreD [unclassified Bacillus (in: firmicutes)]|uniref:rod shape-determining protein MreD n=1 Tax=unclassified Bacillus (in: firmicutes) TaxID=185979 RepID=UPI0008EB9E38|nr:MULTISPECIES: rod shape-determining protein MreD [unclassified Bacillus (in: firmicutes)]SFB16167.1 rod shape-determining protein MreD [Bacillus sp. UNCCL13]SFQ78249.1 rod shape-determining protein MreD [Bacillus sp. cl95]